MRRILVSHEHKFVWIAVAKVASMVMQSAVTERLGIPFGQWPRVTVDSIATVQQMSGYFRFAFVRNPWARLLSCYLDKIIGPTRREDRFILGSYGMRPGMAFDEFVRRVAEIDDSAADEHFVSQFHTLSHAGTLVVDYVGRFENLPTDWDPVRQRCGLREIPWAPVGTSRPRFDFLYHLPYYTPELIDIVRYRYADDIRQFGYEHERFLPVPPQG